MEGCNTRTWEFARQRESAVGSERPAALPVSLQESRAAVEIGLAPDPWLIGAAHLGFYGMDSAEIPVPGHAAQEGADRDKLTGVGISHLERNNIPEIAGRETGAGNSSTVLHERDKPAQDFAPALLHPDIDVRCSRRNTRAEDPAAEPALLTGFFFLVRPVHAISSPFFIRHPDKSMYRISPLRPQPKWFYRTCRTDNEYFMQ